MTQLLNQMSLDEKHAAAARMRASEAERICGEARLARISKEAELMELSNTYAQKILDTLSLAKELGIDPNDLRLAKDPLSFIQSKRPNGQATVPAMSARMNPSQMPVRPRPSSGRSILPSPAQTPSHPSNDSYQNANMPQTSPMHSAALNFPSNTQHVSPAAHIVTQASVPLQGQPSVFAPQGFTNGFTNNAFANNGFQPGMSIFAPSNVFAPANSHSFGTFGNSSFAPFATAGSFGTAPTNTVMFGTAPTNTITTTSPDVEMN
ncbi:hypothetical protein EDD85DRAFT_948571 [Armillaria nabsnona]|nr:hypothetical protein EDD85DRAFT_948571 [Armillaria nabsnona]